MIVRNAHDAVATVDCAQPLCDQEAETGQRFCRICQRMPVVDLQACVDNPDAFVRAWR